MPNTTMAPAGDATFIVPRIRLRAASFGCTQTAGSSGSLESCAVPYSASISSACDTGEGEGGGFVESSSGGRDPRRHAAAVHRRTMNAAATSGRSCRRGTCQNLNFNPS